jgi:hypothetical protein
MYNKEFALYRLGKSSEAAEIHQTIELIDPEFVVSLQDRGTAFFLPESYSDTLDYELPVRWYDGNPESISVNQA